MRVLESSMGCSFHIALVLQLACVLITYPSGASAETLSTGKLPVGRQNNGIGIERVCPPAAHSISCNNPTGNILISGSNTGFSTRFVNLGRIEILYSGVSFNSGLTNNGALLFDPSTITISTLSVGPDGYLAETGDPGDRFIITEDFINQSTRNTDWSTANTIFQFNGSAAHDIGNPQTIEAASADMGNFTAAWQDNFVLGSLQIGPSGTYVLLVDDYDNSASCLNGLCETATNEAVYVNNLTLEDGTTLDLAGKNLYVRNTFTNNGGVLVNGNITTGETPTVAGDISGNGELDGADLLLARRHVLGLITLTPAQLARGDVYPAGGDGAFNTSDLVVLDSLVLQ